MCVLTDAATMFDRRKLGILTAPTAKLRGFHDCPVWRVGTENLGTAAATLNVRIAGALARCLHQHRAHQLEGFLDAIGVNFLSGRAVPDAGTPVSTFQLIQRTFVPEPQNENVTKFFVGSSRHALNRRNGEGGIGVERIP